MKLNGLLDLGQAYGPYRDLVASLATGPAPAAPLGLYHAARPYVVAMLARDLNRPLVVLTARSNHARQWVDELRVWLPDDVPVHFFADPDALPYERIAWAPETRQRRLESLVSLASATAGQHQSFGPTSGPQDDLATPTAGHRMTGDVTLMPGGQKGLSAPTTGPSSAQPPCGTTSADGLQRSSVVVASARALMYMTLPVREMRATLRPLRQGQSFDLNRMLSGWVGLGYESAPVVETPGQFSRRGGIVDVWPPNLRKPLRIELFGDEVDSLRVFDPSTQRTLDRLAQAWIGPASEALPRLGERVAERLQSLDLGPCHPPARVEYEREIGSLLRGSGFRHLEWWIPYLYTQPASLLDYVPASGLLLLDDAAELASALADLEGQAEQLARDLTLAGDVPANMAAPYFAAQAVRERIAASNGSGGVAQDVILGHNDRAGRIVLLSSSTLDGRAASVDDPLAQAFRAGARFGGQVRTILSEIEHSLREGNAVVMVSRQAPRLADLFGEAGHAVAPAEDVSVPPPPGLTLVQGVMDEGWVLSHEGGTLRFLTDAELFGWAKPKPRRPQRTRALAPEVFFSDVQPGDYVVHMEHGIGRFRGLVKLALDGAEREYLQVQYAQDDQLYVPVHQADRLARYVGAGEVGPALHRLGTSDWEQAKERARKAVADIAEDLLELYAAREVVQGHAFGPDAPWQHELEASFPYIETEDQLVAIEAVKHDMERRRPMDRLICGDVGYGKTEVALRAAFKAILDGKQVALLVPTTVLAQQHYTNFTRRLGAFPVSVAMLSRFQTPAQQDRALSGLAGGSIDLVIGTHRLLSNDVAFKDLGLLIVDEEQRFGVAHKERIKQLRTEVDVLTLTATPIPRTLHMSLTGVRDLSTIETPPEERLPVKTFVGEFDETLIRQAILRELDRNGQVYFVHNRVQGIEQMAARVQKIVPEAHIAIGHGQMPERELSTVMLAFAEGEYDVLVCTSIIESGLDIPNANTIIMNRADQFGLAQLYQLRGRVGRSAVRAYAYLLVDRYKALTEEARRRLEAIQEASELGAGFRIAMHDLEIRGAGELLGARQHGHITAVGFDLYTRLLAQAVQEARERTGDVRRLSGRPQASGLPVQDAGERSDTRLAHPVVAGQEPERRNLLEEPLAPTVTLDLNLPARIPESYVPEAPLRLQLYRRMAGLTTLEAVSEMAQELGDRFGPVPEEVANLLYIVRVKVLAVNAGVESVGFEEGQLLIKSAALEATDRQALQERLKAEGVPARVARRAIWLEALPDRDWRGILLKTLEACRGGS